MRVRSIFHTTGNRYIQNFHRYVATDIATGMTDVTTETTDVATGTMDVAIVAVWCCNSLLNST
ncbi:hypothetical protein [Nostoc sp. DSM 114167]|jgi:hypothetical protein|uniref:hypothetical protein n=1 Tax=Nostoc sp. DSM 114167 TaxID=3439050 RepID=UPI0040460A71